MLLHWLLGEIRLLLGTGRMIDRFSRIFTRLTALVLVRMLLLLLLSLGIGLSPGIGVMLHSMGILRGFALPNEVLEVIKNSHPSGCKTQSLRKYFSGFRGGNRAAVVRLQVKC